MSSPEPDKLGHLSRHDVRIVRLRLGYDIYTAVDQHLQSLFDADIGDSGCGFVEVVRRISKECLEELQLRRGEPPEAYLDTIQNAFRTALNRLTAPDAGLLRVAEQIPGSLRIHSPEECLAGFEAMAEQAWHWLQNLISDWGSARSQARLTGMLTAGPATLDIRVGDRDFTYCHYLRDQNQIRLLAGGGASDLDLFFDLPFYFLHEYVSHAFARWDDDRWRLSEAYLLRTAHQYLNEELRQKDRARRTFLGMNFSALRAKSDPNSESDLKKAEDCFAELHDIAGKGFVTHLLEWATLTPEEAQTAECGKLLSGLHALARDPAAVSSVFGATYQGFEAVHQRLNATIENILTTRKQMH